MGALARASHPALYDRGLHPDRRLRRGGRRGGGRAADRASTPRRALGDRARAAAAPAGCAPRSGPTARRSRWAGPRPPACAPPGWRRRGRACRSSAAARGFAEAHRRPLRGARRGRARDRAQLDQGLAVLPPDARLDRGRRSAPASGRRAGGRGGAPGVASGGRAWAPSRADGLQAKFSIPYLIAYTLLHGSPTLASFDGGRRRGGSRAPRRSRCAPTAACSSPRPCCSTRRRGAGASRGGAGLARAPAGRGGARAEGRAAWPAAGWRARSTIRSARPPRCSALAGLAPDRPGGRSTIAPPDLAHGNGGTHGRRSADRRRELDREDSQPAGGDRAHADHARHLLLLLVVLHQPGDARPRQGSRRGPRAEAGQLGLGGHARRAHHRPGDRVRVEHERAGSALPGDRGRRTGPPAGR